MAREGDILDGKYLLRRMLGDGGMGHVFLAENIKLGNKPFAVKTLKPEYLTNKDLVGRFLEEAMAAAKVEHDNIVEVFDADIDTRTGTPYIVQRYLRGTNLREYLDSCAGRKVEPAEALEVLVPVMGALVATHKQKIIHRDIKPENIFLVKTSSGNTVPKLIDFGIAKHLEAPGTPRRASTSSGSIWGTFDYMSPEQARGEQHCDVRADIWSMGAVLFEALTGRLPYEVDGHYALLQKFVAGPPPRVDAIDPTLPRDVAEVVMRALQIDPGARWPTMAAFISALINCQSYHGTVAWRAIPLSSPDLHGDIPDLTALARPATEEHPLSSRPPESVSPDVTSPIRLARSRAVTRDEINERSSPTSRTLELVLPEPWSPRRMLPIVAGVAAVLVGLLVGLRLRSTALEERPVTIARTDPLPLAAPATAPREQSPRPSPQPPPAPAALPLAPTPEASPEPAAPMVVARVARPAPRASLVVRATPSARPRAAAPATTRRASPARGPVIQTEF